MRWARVFAKQQAPERTMKGSHEHQHQHTHQHTHGSEKAHSHEHGHVHSHEHAHAGNSEAHDHAIRASMAVMTIRIHNTLSMVPPLLRLISLGLDSPASSFPSVYGSSNTKRIYELAQGWREYFNTRRMEKLFWLSFALVAVTLVLATGFLLWVWW